MEWEENEKIHVFISIYTHVRIYTVNARNEYNKNLSMAYVEKL